MTPEKGLFAFLALTLVLLTCVVVTGLQARRRLHLPLVAAALVSLGLTIWFAEQLGELYDLSTAGWITSVHLTLAKLTTLAYLAPLVTGILTIRNATWRPRHRLCAIVVLSLTVAAAVTGAWMVLASERLPTPG